MDLTLLKSRAGDSSPNPDGTQIDLICGWSVGTGPFQGGDAARAKAAPEQGYRRDMRARGDSPDRDAEASLVRTPLGRTWHTACWRR